MENASVISLVGIKLPPDPEARKRVQDWVSAAHRPLRRKSPWWIEVTGYKAIRESKDYPELFRIWRYESLKHYDKNLIDPAWKAASEDEKSLRVKYDHRVMWGAIYELKMSFRNGAVLTPTGKENTAADAASLVYLSAYNLSSFIQEKYEEWFSHWGYDVFLPLFMKLPGISGYDFYKFVRIAGNSNVDILEKNYPPFVSLLYFDNSFALENYKTSRELTAFQKVMQADFSGALNTRWDVAYQLEGIFKRED